MKIVRDNAERVGGEAALAPVQENQGTVPGREAISPAGRLDQARRRFHARMDRARQEEVKKNDKVHSRHGCPTTKLTNHVPTRLPTGTGTTVYTELYATLERV